ncbi:enolase C-terminal domain-like protein [Chloroflexota bacterium]
MTKECTIKKILAREVFDSRGVPTIEVDIFTDSGWGRNAAPFGAPGSRGEYEASAYGSVGITGALDVVIHELAPRLVGTDTSKLSQCDSIIREFDGTNNFDRIGGNTASALSIAIAKAAADSLKVPLYKFLAPDSDSFSLPFPLGNIIGGGAHSAGAAPDMQEHLVLPLSANSIKEAVKLNILVHEETGKLLEKRDNNFTGGTDDEHAWAANLDDYQALEVVSEACTIVTRETGMEFRLGLDVAADRLWDTNKEQYVYSREGKFRNTDEQIDFMENLVKKFNLCYVEDAFHSNDYQAFAELRRRVGDLCLVCGDDLLATNTQRTSEGVKKGSVNAMVVKVNQIGTLTDARKTNDYAQSQGIRTIISHRSGETDDHTIAHIGVAWNCAMIKTGVLGGERLTKLNELIRIEENLRECAKSMEDVNKPFEILRGDFCDEC